MIGWEGNYYAPFSYLSGAYFARGVPVHYQQGGTTYCGGMYQFGVYNYGLASGQSPAPGSVHWSMASGYLPALTTSFTRDSVAISITDFADKQTIGGQPTELVYTRVRVTNQGSAAVTVPAGQSGPGLVTLNQASDTVAPGASVQHDYVAAVDTFSTSPLPAAAAVAASAQPYGRAFAHMASYWQGRLSVTPRLDLPNVTLPDTGGLRLPGTRWTTRTGPRSCTPGSWKWAPPRSQAPTTTTGSSTTTCPASCPTGSSWGTSPMPRTCCWSAGSRRIPSSTRWARTGTGMARGGPRSPGPTTWKRPTTLRSSASTSMTTPPPRAPGVRACTP